MSDFLERIGQLSPKRLALLALELNEQLEAERAAARAPIAVIGLGCRFPGGADSPSRYWELLAEGRDGIRTIPADRWDAERWFDPDPDAPGRIGVTTGGFLDRVDGFDAGFFGISPREALTMDPQQRLLLEVAWEALEDAGLAPDRLGGSSTGVFVGLCNNDHFLRALGRGIDRIDGYVASGNAPSVAAGRISYTLGLQGPALTVDTACSSSLVALHVASRSLRAGESRIALAAGVNVMCSPETSIALTKAQMLAPDGRCKTFDAAANGFARGEGCGVVVLKRLDDAVADGDRIHAVIRGTAINQDGRSGGLTVPNGPAQEAVIRAALADAGVEPGAVDYVEAHGTGTSLGDPIEVRALGGALARGRGRGEPLLIGSVKTNFGHLESAAGIAGVIKVILALRNERIPGHLHFRDPSPHIDWSAYPIEVTAASRPWRRGDRPRLAGISSFGFSGTNAHVIVGEAPLDDRSVEAGVGQYLVPISARSQGALARVAEAYGELLDGADGGALADLGYTAAVGRAHFGERAVVLAENPEEACQGIRAIVEGRASPSVTRGSVPPGAAPEIVFLCTGAGAQYPGMIRELYHGSELVREIITRADRILGPDHLGRRLETVLGISGDAAAAGDAIHEMAWTQPGLFTVEFALAELWRSWGILPAAAIGHSVGEYAAACVAGVMTFEDGLQLIAERGRIMQALPAGGAMAALFAPPEAIADTLGAWSGRVSVAAINAPDSVVISGVGEAVDEVLAELKRRNVEGHRLHVSLAAHSPLMEPALDAMEACARRVAMAAPTIPVAWNLTGGRLPSGDAPDALYWRRHLREPVRFGEGVRSLYRDGFRTFLEVGPHPTLIALAQRNLPEGEVALFGSLRRGKPEWRELLGALAGLYAAGARIDWDAVGKVLGGKKRTLPTYSFERRCFWFEPGVGSSREPAPHRRGSIEGRRLDTAAPIVEFRLTESDPAWLADHRVGGRVLLPGPLYLELAQAALAATGGAPAGAIRDFIVHAPVAVAEDGVTLHVELAEHDGGTGFRIHWRTGSNPGWRLAATGLLGPAADLPGQPLLDSNGPAPIAVEADDFYAQLASLGVDFGPAFRTVRAIRRRSGQALVEVEAAVPAAPPAWADPPLIDGILQAAGAAIGPLDPPRLALLTRIGAIELTAPLPGRVRCDVRVSELDGAAGWRADVTVLDPAGSVVARLHGIELQLAVPVSTASGGDLDYRLEWAPVPLGAARTLPAPPDAACPVLESFPARADREGLRTYDGLLPYLDRLAGDYVRRALAELGFDDRPGRRVVAASEAERLGIAPRHTKLFDRLLGMMADDGVLQRDGADFVVAAGLRGPAAVGKIESDWPEGERLMLTRCGGSLAGALTGAIDPIDLLFPNGSFAEARAIYVESPFARTYNGALAEILAGAIGSLPADRHLRILEVGAGTGGTTSFVLPRLPRERVEYVFTDVSAVFLDRAAEQFGSFPGFRTALFDAERDAGPQGIEPGYDIIIAANALHATADLSFALGQLRTLLRSGGWLCLLEGVVPERWVDLTFGLTEGWWRFADEHRADYPLVSTEQWHSLLDRHGFGDIVTIPAGPATTRAAGQQRLMIGRAVRAPRTWTIVGGGGFATALGSLLESSGDRAALLPAGSDPGGWDPDRGDLIYAGMLDLRGVPAPGDAVTAVEDATVGAVQWLARVGRAGAGKVWIVTAGCQPAGTDPVVNPGQAVAWGLARTFSLERPDRFGAVVDLPAGIDPSAAARLVLETVEAGDGEEQVAWRGGVRLAPRLARTARVADATIRLRRDGTYLVTGGFGGLGPVVGRWLAEQGAGTVALLGRNPTLESPEIAAIEQTGATVVAIGADIGDRAGLEAAIADLGRNAKPLRGVVHAAAAFSKAAIVDLDREMIGAMLRPKIAGTMNLLAALENSPLDFVAMFSSTTATLGAAGFGHYGAANQFLDAVSAARPDLPLLSIGWGTWDVMRSVSAETRQEYLRSGLVPMTVPEALDGLGRALAGESRQPMIARIDWAVLKPLHEARRSRPMLSRLETVAKAVPSAARVSEGPSLVDRLATAPASGRRDLLLDFVGEQAAAVLGLDSGRSVPPATGLFDLGMDSLMSVELRRRLEAGAGRTLPSTLTFNYPTVAALAEYLEGALGASVAASAAPPRAAEPDSGLDELDDEDIAARLRAALEDVS